MRALQLVEWNQDPEIRDVPEPEPGPGEVLIRIGGAGACHSDLHLMYDFPPGVVPFELPFTLGHENAGIVEALGAGVDGLEVGMAVAVYGPWGCGSCRRCAAGEENYCERAAERTAAGCGLGLDGGMAPLLRVPSARHVVQLGDLDPVEAAPLTDAGLTPYHAIKRSLDLLVGGSSAVVIGAGGGLGHLSVQLLSALSPAAVIAVDGREAGLSLAKDLGADHGVLAGPRAGEEIKELTRGAGAELVLDLVGNNETLALAASVARPLGHVTLVGIGAGMFSFSFFTVPYECSFQTTYWGSRGELIELLALAERGLVRPRVQRFGLEDAPKAYAAMREGTLEGRAVVVPN